MVKSQPSPEYMQLMGTLAPLDRCHNGPEMEHAFALLTQHYPGARLLRYGADDPIQHWRLPPRWTCNRAELRDESGRLLASRAQHPLAVFTYSPPVDTWLSRDELRPHLLSDPMRPDAILFHFRNQYRHWEPVWGFSIPHRVVETLRDDTRYHAIIESQFDAGAAFPITQAEYLHEGTSGEEILLVGHFDHPGQVNDGLAGCIAAFEAIRRLEGRKTHFGYRALATVEIVGSVAWLENEPTKAAAVREAVFVGFSGIGSPLVHQTSFWGQSRVDRILRHLLSFTPAGLQSFGHRELIGNDENVFDSVHHEIPTSTLMRWPFPQYHTHEDNMAITSCDAMEETVDMLLRLVHVLEQDCRPIARYRGLPSTANPDVNLYFSIDQVSGLCGHASDRAQDLVATLTASESRYILAHPDLPNRLMQNALRMADGRHSVLDIAERTGVPFALARAYIGQMEARGLVTLEELSS